MHKANCCVLHGCKFSDSDCPVINHKTCQDNLCDHCEYHGFTRVEDVGIVAFNAQFDSSKEVVSRPPVNWALIAERSPPPPEILVSALQDRITPACGKFISSKPVFAEDRPLKSQKYFRSLPEADLLVYLQDPNSPVAQLTFAAEIAGELLTASVVVPVLIGLLQHQSAVVREGVVYGLSHHLDDPSVQQALDKVKYSDPSPAVREAASYTNS